MVPPILAKFVISRTTADERGLRYGGTMLLRTCATMICAGFVTACGVAPQSEGGCLYYWNKASNASVRSDAAEYADEEVKLGKAEGVECALQIRAGRKLLAWELHADEHGRYQWRAGKTPPDYEIRQGTIRPDGTFVDNDGGSEI